MVKTREQKGRQPCPLRKGNFLTFRVPAKGTEGVKKLETGGWGSGCLLCMVNPCQWSTDREPYIHITVGVKGITSDFLIDTGAQISVLNKQHAAEMGIKPSRKL